jgi:hypothetical protein
MKDILPKVAIALSVIAIAMSGATLFMVRQCVTSADFNDWSVKQEKRIADYDRRHVELNGLHSGTIIDLLKDVRLLKEAQQQNGDGENATER